MKMKLPPNAGPSVSIQGVPIHADEDGVIDIPDAHVETMKSHGLTLHVEQKSATLSLKK